MEELGLKHIIKWGAILAFTSLLLSYIIITYFNDLLNEHGWIIFTFSSALFSTQLYFAIYKAKKNSFKQAWIIGYKICLINILFYVPIEGLLIGLLYKTVWQFIGVVVFYLLFDAVFCLLIAPFAVVKQQNKDILDR